MNTSRIRHLNNHPYNAGPIIYWMSRDQRVLDNWSLIYAQNLAKHYHTECAVVFCLVDSFLGATHQQFGFMIEGLQEVADTLAHYHIPFYLLHGNPVDQIQAFIINHQIGYLVTDFSPVRIGRKWRDTLSASVSIPCDEVDSHNIIPAWITSNKQEFAARTIRPKIHKFLPEYMDEFPSISKQLEAKILPPCKNIFPSTNHAKTINSGSLAAHNCLDQFLTHKLDMYDKKRNDPTQDMQSHLAPYLHFGHISAQKIAQEIYKQKPTLSRQAFLEELIVRRELSDNFCFYNPNYDRVEGFPNWAKMTLDKHRKDTRTYIYTQEQFEQAKTHDDLWNAAQREMVHTGKMHGYMRMYWAKKILEWTRSPEDALSIAIYLNDTYQLDGRDPNGYAGIAWSIGGVHDRPWFERSIYGTIRYMSYNGCKGKFAIAEYIKRYEN